MKDILEVREERIKYLIEIGFTADLDKGIIYRPNGRIHNSKGNKGGYKEIARIYNDKFIRVKYHQFIYYLAHNKVVDIIDHFDRDRFNNSISNLREVSVKVNTKNRVGKGYSLRKERGTYRASIRHNGKLISLGDYLTEEEASKAYLSAKIKYEHL